MWQKHNYYKNASKEVGLEVNTLKTKYMVWLWNSRNDFIVQLEGNYATWS
jgi:hypothetical protein